MVSIPRETEGKEKDEGSLSIFIVPIEIREIGTAESRRVGKGDAGGQACSSETLVYQLHGKQDVNVRTADSRTLKETQRRTFAEPLPVH